MKNDETKTGTFFQEFQKKNVLNLLQTSVEKIINQWLITDDGDNAKLKNLQQLASKNIDDDTLPEKSLPDYVKHLWQNPHEALNTLDKEISTLEVRQLIKTQAKEIELIHTHQKPPAYS